MLHGKRPSPEHLALTASALSLQNAVGTFQLWSQNSVGFVPSSMAAERPKYSVRQSWELHEYLGSGLALRHHRTWRDRT